MPVASGGQSTLANGVCASWAANFDKRDRVGGYVCLFIDGRPTTTYLNSHTTLPRSLERRFRRFSRLCYSDWYLNRALFRLWLGVAYLSDENCERTRDEAYYARAAYRILIRWRTTSKRERVPTLEERGLAPRQPATDQKILLRVRAAASVREIQAIMRLLVPHYVAKAVALTDRPDPRQARRRDISCGEI